MRRALRRLRGRYPSLAARRVAIRPQKPWYFRGGLALILILAGYLLAFWQIYYVPQSLPDARSADQRALLSQVVMMERQLQIEHAARTEVAKEMAGLQEEVMRLKEDVQFYQSILAESGNAGVVRFHSIRFMRAEQPNKYHYRVVLVQSGRHDRLVDGRMHFKLVAKEGASSRLISISGDAAGIPVKFKYYQRLEGEFMISDTQFGNSVKLELIDARKRSIALSETIPLPRM